MKNFEVRIAILVACLISCGKSDNDYDGPLTIKLFHSLSDSWIPCSNIAIQNVNTGSVNVKLIDWNATTSEQLLELAKKDQLYKMKALVLTSKGREIEFRTFTKANKLVVENVTISLLVTLDYTGSVMAISLKAIPPMKEMETMSTSPTVFPSLIIRPTKLGPVPDTASYIQKLEREREAKQRGGNQDNRSFFSKYWIYIALLVVFGVLSGATGETGHNPR